ncbi:MAG: hypothetical protein U5N86_03240 [Planctomycetota bacterium]|nr:hypothetical protein [Planctomycetota bacterium]
MVTFFASLKDINKDKAALPEFLSTHPEMQKRIDRANMIIREKYTLPDGSLRPPPALPSNGAPVDVSEPS